MENTNKRKIFGRAGNSKIRALAVVPIALAIVFMLTVGGTISQQQSASVNKNITKEDVVAAHDGCPCTTVKEKIYNALELSGIGNFSNPGEIDPGTMCSFYSDEETSQFIVANAPQLLCGGTFSYVWVPGSASSPIGAVEQSQQSTPIQRDVINFGGIDPIRSLPGAVPSVKKEGISIGGHWAYLQTGTETRTAEQVVAEYNAIRDYWCSGTPIPPGTLDPGDWTPGQALAWCVGFTGMVLQIPMRIVNMMFAAAGMRFCADLMVYSWIDHQLQEAGYTDITALTIYTACYDYLTGGT